MNVQRRLRILFAAAAILASHAMAARAQPAPSSASDRALLREILQQLVEIPTTEQETTTPRAARALADRLVAAGVPLQDVRVLGPDARVGNLVARVRGRNTTLRPVLLMAHLDVVPASAADWTVDPWKLTEREGWFYGRGTHDNKAGVATLIANLVRLKRENWQPTRDVIVLLTADEETSQASLQWLLKEHRALIDAELAFNIDAGAVNYRAGRPVFFDFQSSEKVYAEFSRSPMLADTARSRVQATPSTRCRPRSPESASISFPFVSTMARGCSSSALRRLNKGRRRSICDAWRRCLRILQPRPVSRTLRS